MYKIKSFSKNMHILAIILSLALATVVTGSCGSKTASSSENKHESTTIASPEDLDAQKAEASTNASNQENSKKIGEIMPPGENPGDMAAPPDEKPGDMPPGGLNGGNGMPPGDSNKPSSYAAMNTYTESENVVDLDLTSNGKDESAILLDKNFEVTINNFKINRVNSESTGGDTASFYGVGAATLVTEGTLNLNVGDISTDAKGAAGIFAYGNGTANALNVNIETKKDTSGGIHVAGGGKLYAGNVNATTFGESSAAIRSDRGGGKMEVDGGKFTTNGSGSPAIYCTADITVNDAKLIANNSEGICIEGHNTTTLNNCDLTCNMPNLSQNDCTWSVIVYQSMSGDSQIGKGTFNMEGGTLTSKNGGIFYTTNTESEFNLTNVEIIYSNPNRSSPDFFLKATGNKNQRGWGKENANGANCTFNASMQELYGPIHYDSISTLELNLKNNSTFEGTIIDDESAVNNTKGNGYANVSIDETSSWHLTSDATINKLTLKGSLLDQDGETIKIIDKDGNTLREGTSTIATLTVNELM